MAKSLKIEKLEKVAGGQAASKQRMVACPNCGKLYQDPNDVEVPKESCYYVDCPCDHRFVILGEAEEFLN